MKKNEKLYFAFGSNLSVDAMRVRCPAAQKVGPLAVTNIELVFRAVADIRYKKGAVCHGGLWLITPACEAALDRYEGVSVGGSRGLYEKVYFPVKDEASGRTHQCLAYKMTRKGIMPPSEYYLSVIIQGYADFGLDLVHLDRAVKHSWGKKHPTPYLLGRRAREGTRARSETVSEAAQVAEEGLP